MLIQTQSIGAVERVETKMTIRPYLSIIAVLVVAATTLHAADEEGQAADQKATTSWERSYKAGYVDGQGRYAGGSEILHLEGHKGKLYAPNSYWMDPSNIWYGGKDPKTAWSQILRLDSPNGKWEVDLELGPNNLRAENLKSVTFGTDGAGHSLEKPVTMLMPPRTLRILKAPTSTSLFVMTTRGQRWSPNALPNCPTGLRQWSSSLHG